MTSTASTTTSGGAGPATGAASGLSVSRLGKHYERTDSWALRELTLDIAGGSFTVILGQSGSGKSTLLRLLAGLVTPTTGEIRHPAGARSDVRYVFQDYAQSLFPWTSVWRNVRFGARHGGVPRAEWDETVRDSLRRVGLLEHAGKRPWELSGGMQQRVAIARALASRPGLLLLDEPFGAVDALSRARLQDTVLDIWTSLGLTVVLVTHDIDEAIYLGDRVVVLHPRGDGLRLDLPVELPRPRDQAATKEQPEFGRHRRRLLAAVSDG